MFQRCSFALLAAIALAGAMATGAVAQEQPGAKGPAPTAAENNIAAPATKTPNTAPSSLSLVPTVRAFVQTGYVAGQKSPNTFKINRLEISLSADVTRDWSYFVLFDPAKGLALPTISPDPAHAGGFLATQGGDDKVLHDAFVRLTRFGWAFQMGQFKVPLSANGLESSSELLLVRRALFDEGPTQVGFSRDLGVKLEGAPLPGVRVVLAVLNGETANVLDKNANKNVVGRLYYNPWPFLEVGAADYVGTAGVDAHAKHRLDVDAALAMPPFVLRAEGLYAVDGPTPKLGYYVLAGWRCLGDFELVTRFDSWDPDLKNGALQRDVTLGLNWYLTAGSANRMQLNLVHEALVKNASDNQLLLNWQLKL